jgi:peptidoglycan-N-acetylglucosamine deacetylase
MNLDIIGIVAAVLVLAWLLWFLWNVVRGHTRRRRGNLLRFVVTLAVAVVLVGWGAYWLMNSRTVMVMGDHVSRVDTTRKVVALTFDDGPDEAYGAELIGDLQQAQVQGTFYVIGAVAAAHPAALRALVASGAEIGNHSYTHRRLVFVSTTTVRQEIDRTNGVIRAAGYTGPITVRPPYAKKLLSYPFEMASSGRATVMWDLEPDSVSTIRDDARAMTDYVAQNVQPGSIIEFHPWAPGNTATRKAIPLVIAELQRQGYQLVTVSRLLSLR